MIIERHNFIAKVLCSDKEKVWRGNSCFSFFKCVDISYDNNASIEGR